MKNLILISEIQNNLLIMFEILSVFLFLVCLSLLYFLKKAKKNNNIIRKNLDKYFALMNGVTGAIFIYDVKELKITQCNDLFYDIIDYSKDEFEKNFNNDFAKLIFLDDLNTLFEKLLNLDNKKITQEVRIKIKNDEMRWLFLEINNTLDANSKHIAYCVALDITVKKKMEQQNHLEHQRYKMLLSKTKDTIFNYDINKRVVSFSSNFKSVFGFSKLGYDNLFSDEKIKDYIYKEDFDTFKQFMQLLKDEVSFAETEIRILSINKIPIWCKIFASVIYDYDNKITGFFGVISNVDKDKKDFDYMKNLSERDSLTLLYNKNTAENLIKSYMNYYTEKCALIIIDIDNLKRYNDEYGHLCGDKIIEKTAKRLSSLFRVTDIVGRFGGDEFVVFMGNLDELYNIEDKLKEVLKELSEQVIFEGKAYPVSASLGVSLYNKDTKDFKELFEQADKALYESKNRGKNTFSFYKN